MSPSKRSEKEFWGGSKELVYYAMSYPEQSFGEGSLSSGVLPPELAAFLQGHDYACVTEATDH
jgi:hypothetical protein